MASEGFQDQIIPSESEHSETLHILLSKSIEHNRQSSKVLAKREPSGMAVAALGPSCSRMAEPERKSSAQTPRTRVQLSKAGDPLSEPSIFICSMKLKSQEKVIFKEQAAQKDLNVTKEKEERTMAHALKLVSYNRAFLLGHVPLHLDGTRSQMPQTTDLKWCGEQLRACCKRSQPSHYEIKQHEISRKALLGWPQPFQVSESTMAASKRQAQGKKSKVRSLGQCKAGRMDDLQCVQAYCSFIPTFNNPHTALRRRYSKRSLSHQRQRHHSCISFQEHNSARDQPRAPELSHLCCQLWSGPAPTRLCQGSVTPRHGLRATGPGARDHGQQEQQRFPPLPPLCLYSWMHSRTANQARKPISPDRYPDTAAQLHKRFARTAREAAQIRPTCPSPGGVCAEREQHCHRHQHPACHSSEQREKQLGAGRALTPCHGRPPAFTTRCPGVLLQAEGCQERREQPETEDCLLPAPARTEQPEQGSSESDYYSLTAVYTRHNEDAQQPLDGTKAYHPLVEDR
ncbi:hypothetical protein Anapl_00108 [Anas platyrhynchos]|uniref:Uncharacterized protein n=1 Tax=Anas platyrhynchos TaxID=8839 RepID=R0K1G1_ANAPL|nr:hypothetical protein Anapl_00108 [Anas platyrhynchos]